VKPCYLLDTNICIALLKGAPESVVARFASCSVGEAAMSAITYAELEFGAAVSPSPEQERTALAALLDVVPVASFDRAAGAAYAAIRKATRDRKSDALDKLIAAHAVALEAVVVTNNESDFSRYPGVVIENWLAAQ
jgi:tRNA(fMet)-specific endonuclease VapC